MINQGYANPRLLPNAGLAPRFPGPAAMPDEQLWLQPRNSVYGVKPEVQLLQNQQLYSNNVGFKPNTLQNLQYVANDSDFARPQGAFLQQQQQQPVQSQMNQFNTAGMSNLIGNAGNANWQALQQQTTLHQQAYTNTQLNQMLYQQNQQQQQHIHQLAAAMESQKFAQANTIQARNAQMQQAASHIGMQNQLINGGAGFVNGVKHANLIQQNQQQQQRLAALNAARYAAGRPAGQMGALNNGFGNVGNPGMGGQNMNFVNNQAAVRQQQLQLQQQANANAAAQRNYPGPGQMSGLAGVAGYQGPGSTASMTSMMLDNQATLARQHQLAAHQQNSILKTDFGMPGPEQRNLGAGIHLGDMNSFGGQMRGGAAAHASRIPIPQPQHLMNGGVGGQPQYGQQQARRSPYDMPSSMAMQNGLGSLTQDPKVFNASSGMAMGNPITRPAASQQAFRPAAAEGYHASLAGRVSPSIVPAQLPSQFVPPRPLLSDAQVAEGMAAAEAVGKSGPPLENFELYKAVGEELARMGISVDQAVAKGLLSSMNSPQISAVRDACAAQLSRMMGTAPAARQSPMGDAASQLPAQQQQGPGLGLSLGHGLLGPLDPAQAVTPPATSAPDLPTGVLQMPTAIATAAPAPAAAATGVEALGGEPVAMEPVARAASVIAPPSSVVAPQPVVEAEAPVLIEAQGAHVAGSPEGVLSASLPAAAAAGGVFNAFGYGFFSSAPVEGAEEEALLEALEPDGGAGQDQDVEGVPAGGEENGDVKDAAEEVQGQASASATAGVPAADRAAAEAAAPESALSSKFTQLDLGCGFA